jgi:integrase
MGYDTHTLLAKRNIRADRQVPHAKPLRPRPARRRSAPRRRRPANAGQRYPAEIPTPDEVRALIKACSNRASTGIRNRALLVLLYRAGCRISEALRLLPKYLDRAAGTATVGAPALPCG